MTFGRYPVETLFLHLFMVGLSVIRIIYRLLYVKSARHNEMKGSRLPQTWSVFKMCV